jgi:rSAM/selenodomain-associated transferase 1
MNGSLILIAKEPAPGRAKTRLCPPCTPPQAAALARASLLDTLAVLARTPARRRVLAFDGEGGERWLPRGFELIAQRGDGLARRLAAAFEDVDGPALLVGMDTPQLTSALLLSGLQALTRPGVDAVLGPAHDGGYWSIGLRAPCAEAFAGVPMSVEGTCAAQREALLRCGLATHELPALRDVDTIADAREVARLAPWSRFAAALRTIETPAGGLAA